MISAAKARVLTDDALFAASPWATLAERNIHDAIRKGENRFSMLIPVSVADKMERFLKRFGYKVSASMMLTGVLLTAAW